MEGIAREVFDNLSGYVLDNHVLPIPNFFSSSNGIIDFFVIEREKMPKNSRNVKQTLL